MRWPISIRQACDLWPRLLSQLARRDFVLSEDAGWQVTVEGDIIDLDADELIAQITR